MRVTTHRRFIDGDFATPTGHQVGQFLLHNWNERLGDRKPVGVVTIRNETPAQCIRAGNTGFENRSGWRQTLQPLKFFNHAKTSWRAERAGDPVFSALIVSGRPETSRGRAFKLN